MKGLRILLYGFFFLAMTACADSHRGFVLTGDFGESPGEKVVLKKQIGLEVWTDADSTLVDHRGVFRFKGAIPYPEFVYVYLTGKRKFVRFFLENANVRILPRYDSLLMQPYVEGSATMDTFRMFRHLILVNFSNRIHGLNMAYRKATSEGDTTEAVRILHQRDSLVKRQELYEQDFIVKHRSSILAPFLLGISYMNYSPEALDSMMTLLDPELDSTLYVKNLKQRIYFRNNSTPGHQAPALSLPDTSGRMYSLDEWSGRYLLLNFWATWNIRSMNLSRQLIPLYNCYHEHGFDIMGISLDTNVGDWIQMVKKDKLPWIQVLESDGPRGLVPTQYNITGFPQFILIDPEGVILARINTVRGLDEWLASVYN